MVLQPFSIPEHIDKIKNGVKTQTTRRGIRDLSPGTKLQQYYRPRMKKGTCANCINTSCSGSKMMYYSGTKCPDWNNFFGEVPVSCVITFPFGIQSLNKSNFEEWARNDGFDSTEQADEWFENQYGIGWKQMPVTVIQWDNGKRVYGVK